MIIQSKGINGSVDTDDEGWHGMLLGVRGLYTYEGETYSELIDAFYETVDIYLADQEKAQMV